MAQGRALGAMLRRSHRQLSASGPAPSPHSPDERTSAPTKDAAQPDWLLLLPGAAALRPRSTGFARDSSSSSLKTIPTYVIRRLYAPGTMIVEFPFRGCISTPARARKRMIRARSTFVHRFGAPTSDWHHLHRTGIITGVDFFDIKHGQTGVAPNAIELHPVIGFRAR